MINWPPIYTLKKHPRTRQVKLKASMQHGLQLLVPKRFNEKHISEILELNKQWIIKKLTAIQETKQRQPDKLPTEISLLALEQQWPVHYLKTDHKKIKLMVRPQKELVLIGNIHDERACKKLLKEWIKSQALLHLPIILQKISEKTGLIYHSLTIRSQQHRWGSCSSQKSINLNYKLLFLPPHLVEHIILHELCHTVHLNHSQKFWELVASFDPHWKQHSKESRKASLWVPGWVI